ncbi:hypothetical protein ASA1KI_36130 [Opitutales bacterium ASA1]|uniref:oligosaccharide flippase family protein n=1 Tax=Congregicoccus parvus TaxID=3081749 RepID=UPI002B2C2FF8|nr:hypothetical protein ASA1KI_36130 [Opitutales bacterium ASA1]
MSSSLPAPAETSLTELDAPRSSAAPRSAFAGSIVWLTLEKILRAFGSITVGLLVARFLGPEDYGRLGVALGLAGVGRELVTLALERIIRRDLAARAHPAGDIFGTYLLAALVVGLGAIGVLSVFAVTSIGDAPTRTIVLLLVWMTLPQILVSADWWFESQCRARPMVIARNTVWLLGMALKVLFVVAHFGLLAFAILALLELVLSASIVWRAFRIRQDRDFRLAWNGRLFAGWMRENWSVLVVVLLSALSDRLLAYITQHAAGNVNAGFFGAAQRLIEAWWALFIMASGVLLPRMTQLRTSEDDRFERFTQSYFDLSFGLAFAVAVAGTFGAHLIVPLLLGAEYAGAAPVIVAMLWATPAGFVFLARVQYSTAVHRIALDFPSSIATAIFTLLLSVLWAPVHGAAGVAWAGTVSLWLGVYAVPLLWPKLRRAHPHQWHALLFFVRARRLALLVAELASRGRREFWH